MNQNHHLILITFLLFCWCLFWKLLGHCLFDLLSLIFYLWMSIRQIRLIFFVCHLQLDVYPFNQNLKELRINYCQTLKINHRCFNLQWETNLVKIFRKNFPQLIILLHKINFQNYHSIFYKVHLLISISNHKILVLVLFKLMILLSSNLISNEDL